MEMYVYKIPGECHVFLSSFSTLTDTHVFLNIPEMDDGPLQLEYVCNLIISAQQLFEINCFNLPWMETYLKTD